MKKSPLKSGFFCGWQVGLVKQLFTNYG
jgi:hypothetical protein